MYLVGHYYPTPKQIKNILKPDTSGLAARWHDLGTQLLTDDTVGVLDVIKVNHPNNARVCCNEMFVKWLKLQPDASWSQLITALRNIGMKSAAENIIKHFIKGLCSYPFINIMYPITEFKNMAHIKFYVHMSLPYMYVCTYVLLLHEIVFH